MSPPEYASEFRIKQVHKIEKRLRTENVGVMVKDSARTSWIKRVLLYSLGGPRFRSGIIDVDVVRFRSVGPHEINCICELPVLMSAFGL